MRVDRLSGDRGQVAPLIAVCLLGLLAVAGLVIDAGVLFAARRDLQAVADGAARTGAMAVDEQALRERGGWMVELDPEAAREAAGEYLDHAGFLGGAEVSSDTESVRVTLSRDRPTLILSLVGVRTLSVEASSVARPRSGIEEAGGS